MTTSNIRLRLIISLILLLGAPGQVLALPGLGNARPNLETPRFNASPSSRVMGIDQAIDIAERRYNGRAVGARHLGNGVYRVRILQNNGKVKTVTISDPGARR